MVMLMKKKQNKKKKERKEINKVCAPVGEQSSEVIGNGTSSFRLNPTLVAKKKKKKKKRTCWRMATSRRYFALTSAGEA